jgi:hypothetical protein
LDDQQDCADQKYQVQKMEISLCLVYFDQNSFAATLRVEGKRRTNSDTKRNDQKQSEQKIIDNLESSSFWAALSSPQSLIILNSLVSVSASQRCLDGERVVYQMAVLWLSIASG